MRCNKIMPKWQRTGAWGKLTININGVEPSAEQSSTFICSCIIQLNAVNFQPEAIQLYSTSWLDFNTGTAIIPWDILTNPSRNFVRTLHGFSALKVANMVFLFQYCSVFWKKNVANQICCRSNVMNQRRDFV